MCCSRVGFIGLLGILVVFRWLALTPMPEVCQKRFACFEKAAITMPEYSERVRFFYEVDHELHLRVDLLECENGRLIRDTYFTNASQIRNKAVALNALVSEAWETHSGLWGIFFAFPSPTFEPICVFSHNLTVYYIPRQERHAVELYDLMGWAYKTCVSPPPQTCKSDQTTE